MIWSSTSVGSERSIGTSIIRSMDQRYEGSWGSKSPKPRLRESGNDHQTAIYYIFCACSKVVVDAWYPNNAASCSVPVSLHCCTVTDQFEETKIIPIILQVVGNRPNWCIDSYCCLLLSLILCFIEFFTES